MFEFERQVFQVREEIERLQGRLRYLSNQTSYSTVTIQLHEQREYVPPQTPTYAERVAEAWTASRTRLAEAGTLAVIVSLYVVPWLLIVLPLLWLAYRVAASVMRRCRPRPVAA